MNILYIGWLGYGNLGDDLLWDVFRSLADRYLDPNRFMLVPSWPKQDLRNVDSYDLVLLGGGSLITPVYIDILYNALKRKKAVAIWGSGLDKQSKDQIEPLLANQGTFRHAYKPDFLKKLAEIAEHANYVGVRGPLTHAAFKRMGVNMTKTEMSGDPGLLVHPSYRTRLPADSNVFDSTEKIIGLNWGTTFNKLYGEDERQVEDHLARAMKRLISQGYKIYLYNVWGEDLKASNRLYEKIGDSKHVIKAPKLYHQTVLVRILSRCCFTINFKLHANVLSAAAGSPFIALGYRFKIFDFTGSLDSTELTIPTDSPCIEDEIIRIADYIVQNRDNIVRKFAMHTQIYKEKLARPFRKGFGFM